MNDEAEVTNYVMVDIKTGKPVDGFGDDYIIISPTPPKVGEYLNQSGVYFEILALVQSFDTNYVDVFVKPLGDYTNFLTQIQMRHLASSS